MADENTTPGTDVGSEAEETLDAASAPEDTGAGAEVEVTEEVEPSAPAKSAAAVKAAAPAKSAAAAKPAAKASKAPAAARPRVRPAVESGAAEPRTGRRKVREGIVISNAMEKTAVVAIIERVRHPRYAKTVQRTKRLYAHDETNDTRVGDRVRLSETRPLSKLKRWRVEQVLERAR
jgi:small subunit ribosomal protein S17